MVEESKDQMVERTTEMMWDELSKILEKADGFMKGEKIKEITLIKPRKIKIVLERKH